MDLLACSSCELRYYVPGLMLAEGRRCPQCGEDLALVAHGITSIPLDAHSLEFAIEPTPQVTVVELRRKRKRASRNGRRIVSDLAHYFPVKAVGHSVRVSVNRGAGSEAALRVAAVLDGVDETWEEHFYLPTSGYGEPTDHPQLQPQLHRGRGHLRAVPDPDRSSPPGRLA
jgi:hypothetical protein